MQNIKQRIIDFVKKYYKKKRFWAILIIVIIIIFMALKPAPSTVKISTDVVKYVDLKQTVLATGQVTSNTDLNLSFNSTGIVKLLKVKVGDNVKKGDILATLDQGQVLGSLTQARGALLAAQARYKKVVEGGDVSIAQVALDQARKTNDVLVKNAYKNLLNSTPEALPSNGTNDYTAPIISGTYNLGQEGVIKIKVYASSSDSGYSFVATGLVDAVGTVATNTAQPIGNSGLSIRFSTIVNANNSEWIITLPNKKASNYLANYNAYQQALSNAESAIEQRMTELAVKKSQSGGTDVDLARAEITQAEGQLQAAQAKYEDTILRAPADGTITNIDLKLGELSEAQKPIMTLQDISNLYVEAKINESNIANIVLGQKVSMTFDAFGTSRTFSGSVVHIDPGATTTDGIVNYKIKASIDDLDKAIRSGMNADISIITAEKSRVLVIPKAAITTRDGKTFVNLTTEKNKEDYKEKEIEIGLVGDGNLTEITRGLSEGEVVAIISKQ